MYLCLTSYGIIFLSTQSKRRITMFNPSNNSEGYVPPTELFNRIMNDYTYHSPTPEQVIRYNKIREMGKEFALLVITQCPGSREASLALTQIEQAVFFANAAIARNEKELRGPGTPVLDGYTPPAQAADPTKE
jgi:hypothetical protein